MCNVVQLCLAKFACDRFCVKMAARFVSRSYSLKNKFGDRISDKQINHLLQPSTLANN